MSDQDPEFSNQENISSQENTLPDIAHPDEPRNKVKRGEEVNLTDKDPTIKDIMIGVGWDLKAFDKFNKELINKVVSTTCIWYKISAQDTAILQWELRSGFAAQLACPLVNAWVHPGSYHTVSDLFHSTRVPVPSQFSLPQSNLLAGNARTNVVR